MMIKSTGNPFQCFLGFPMYFPLFHTLFPDTVSEGPETFSHLVIFAVGIRNQPCFFQRKPVLIIQVFFIYMNGQYFGQKHMV